MSILWFIIIGGIAGFLASKVLKKEPFGMVGNIAIGIAGAFIGGWLIGRLMDFAGLVGDLLTALLGAIILLWLIDFFKSRK